MEPIVKPMELKTSRDYRKLSGELDDIIQALLEHEYGFYKIPKEKRHLFVMLENMLHLQLMINKGVRVLGGFDTLKIEVYDIRKRHNEIDQSLKNFKL